jgi:hypothetical protein
MPALAALYATWPICPSKAADGRRHQDHAALAVLAGSFRLMRSA